MIPAIFLLVLCCTAYLVMITTRRRARARTAGLASLEEFNDRVAEMIRCAGLHHDGVSRGWNLSISDLRQIRRNVRRLQQEGSVLGEKLGTWKDVAEKLYLEQIQIGLGNVSSGLTCNLFISALEITLGKIREHGHYFYTAAALGTYCEIAYMIESMEHILEREAPAEALRRHLR